MENNEEENWEISSATQAEAEDARNYQPTVEDYHHELVWNIDQPNDKQASEVYQDSLLDKILELKRKGNADRA